MTYSQKYCLVSFVVPQKVNTQFSMAAWPVHVTVADVFALDVNRRALDELANLSAKHVPFTVTADEVTTLGSSNVILFKRNKGIISLHNELIDVIKLLGGYFNNLEFTGDGFVPHASLRDTEIINPGDIANINQISLIDMFPNSDWQQRKVLHNFRLGHHLSVE